MYNIIFFADISFSYMICRSYGIHRLATELREQGYSVLCVNFTSTMNFEMYEEILDSAIGENTYMVGFSSTWFPYIDTKSAMQNNKRSVSGNPSAWEEYNPTEYPWYFESLPYQFTQVDSAKWIDAIKKRNPKTKVTVGGAKAGQYIRNPKLDNVFIGYSETMMFDYINSISKKGPVRIFNKVIDYDSNAARDTWDFKNSVTRYIDEDIVLPTETLAFEFSRGCVFSCAFCSYPLVGKKGASEYVKYKEIIRSELLENYEKWGITKYYIVDDTFNDTVEKLKVIYEVIQSLPFKPKFWCYARIDLIAAHPEMAQLMLDIGIKEINHGIETFHPEAGKIIKKGNPEKKKLALKMAKEVWGKEVWVNANIIIGLPKEPVQSIRDSVDWYVNEGYKYVEAFGMNMFTFLNKLENDYTNVSAIERDYEKYGYQLDPHPEDPLNWTKNDGTDLTSRVQARELIKELLPLVRSKETAWKNLLHYTVYEPIDPKLSWENLSSIPAEEFDDKISRKIKPQELYKQYVDTYYWPRLFEILKKKKNG